MKKILAFLLLPLLAIGANVQVRNLTVTTVVPAADDYFMLDGTTNNTSKNLALNWQQVTPTRATLAALIITNAANQDAVQTLGATAPGDGGGALYFYSQSSTATPNGVTVIAPNAGSGRWLIALGGSLPAPTPSSLGGVFSKAAVAHNYVTGVDTAGNILTSTIASSDISGLGSMASQNSNAVAITGGTITGLSSPLPIASGGTGGTDANSARIALGAAASSITLDKTLNLSDLSNVTTARANLGLGSLATQSGIFSGTSSGTNTGDQTITLTGPVTGTGTGSFATTISASAIGTTQLANNAVTNAKLAAMNPLTVKGNNNASFGLPPVDLTISQTKTMLAYTASDISGLGGAALLNVGTTTGTVAAGNDSRFLVAGGATGAFLVKTSGTDYAVGWQAPRIINVKDYGATGNGSTDDLAAINLARAAMTNNSALYFPQGVYRITGQINTFNSLSGITVFGEGATIYNDSGSAGGNTMVFDSSTSNYEVRNLSFTGSSTVRGSGIHIRAYGSGGRITNCYFGGCSDFAVLLTNNAGTWSNGFVVENCVFNHPLGDGIHVGNATDVLLVGNEFLNTGDDSIGIVADDVAHEPNRVTVVGGHIYNAGSRGIAILEAVDVLVEGVQIYTSATAAIEVGRYNSTTAYNTRIKLQGNKIYNSTAGGVGPRGAIWLKWISEGDCTDNQIIDTAYGSSINFLDINEFVIAGNLCRKSPFRGIASDDSTIPNVGLTWNTVVITNNHLDWVQDHEAIYAVPALGMTISKLIIAGNDGETVSGNWIYADRVTSGRIGNNINTDGATVATGSSYSGTAPFNNN